MSKLDDLAFVPEQFSGKARLFPLPNLVMFPHVMQPLHIFEDRYRALLEEAMADDRLIAMTLLAPGWEKNYDGRPALHPVGCLGRVAASQQQPDGRSNILLLGLRRVRLVEELPARKLFREAEVAVIEDDYHTSSAARRTALQSELLGVFQQALPKMKQTAEQMEQLLGRSITLGMLTDIIGYTLELDLKLKQQLLEESNVDARAQTLIRHVRQVLSAPADETAGGFPPDFSVN